MIMVGRAGGRLDQQWVGAPLEWVTALISRRWRKGPSARPHRRGDRGRQSRSRGPTVSLRAMFSTQTPSASSRVRPPRTTPWSSPPRSRCSGGWSLHLGNRHCVSFFQPEAIVVPYDTRWKPSCGAPGSSSGTPPSSPGSALVHTLTDRRAPVTPPAERRRVSPRVRSATPMARDVRTVRPDPRPARRFERARTHLGAAAAPTDGAACARPAPRGRGDWAAVAASTSC